MRRTRSHHNIPMWFLSACLPSSGPDVCGCEYVASPFVLQHLTVARRGGERTSVLRIKLFLLNRACCRDDKPWGGHDHKDYVVTCPQLGSSVDRKEADWHANERVVWAATIDWSQLTIVWEDECATEVPLWIEPLEIDRHGGTPEIMAMLRLPKGITDDQLDMNQPLMLYPGGIEAIYQFTCEYSGRIAIRTSVFACFDKNELMDAVPDDGPVELTVAGSLGTGQNFYGSDTMTIGNGR